MAKEEAAVESAENGQEGAAAPKKSRKKLFIIIAIALVIVLAGSVTAVLLIKEKKNKTESGKEQETVAEKADAGHADGKADPKHPPTFVPIERFVFNLTQAPADKTGVGQIEMQVLVEDAPVSEVIKNYMPIIRNNVLLLLTSKSYEEMATPEGKLKLQEEILDAIRAPLPARKDKGKDLERGVKSVHFSAFIMN